MWGCCLKFSMKIENVISTWWIFTPFQIKIVNHKNFRFFFLHSNEQMKITHVIKVGQPVLLRLSLEFQMKSYLTFRSLKYLCKTLRQTIDFVLSLHYPFITVFTCFISRVLTYLKQKKKLISINISFTFFFRLVGINSYMSPAYILLLIENIT